MTGSLAALAAALVAFVGSHFLLSWPPLRGRLVGSVGEKGFLAVYSLVALVTLAWVILAFRAAPVVWWWVPGPGGRHAAFSLMPLALIFVVAGLTSPSPTAVGGDHTDLSTAVRGVTTVTRHPFLIGVTLWALAHLAANGDARGVMLFVAMAALAIGGMAAIDHKRAVALGAGWKSFADRTSVFPFAAAVAGRTRIDWRGIGWARVLAALVVFVVLIFAHGWLGRPLLRTGGA